MGYVNGMYNQSPKSIPASFAEASKSPLYPQYFAEIMGGRVPISESKAEIPLSLSQTLIGEKTASEIGWLK